jgi:hypothetical protein
MKKGGYHDKRNWRSHNTTICANQLQCGSLRQRLAVQKTDKIRKQRPVEKGDDGQKPELNLQNQANMRTRNSIEDGKLVVEKYDEDGNLVRKTPPGYLPIGERV